MSATKKHPGLVQYIPAFLIVAIGLSLTWLVVDRTRSADAAGRASAFLHSADVAIAAAEQKLQAQLGRLAATSSLLGNVDDISFAVFREFVRPLIASGAGIQAFAWVPRVPSEERGTYEAAMQAQGFPSFGFLEVSARGRLTNAVNRPDYMPVYYVEPIASGSVTFGVDLATNERMQAAMQVSLLQGTVTAAAPATSAGDGRLFKGLFIFAPVYQSGVFLNDPATRASAFRGFVVQVIDMRALIAAATAPAATPQLGALNAAGSRPVAAPFPREVPALHIFDVTDPAQIGRIYSADVLAGPAVFTRTNLLAGQSYGRTVQAVGRSWQIIATPKVVTALATIPWGTLAAGLLLTVLTAAFAVSSAIRYALAERQISVRTRALNSARGKISRALQAAEAARSSRSAFFATMSHKLRTPLTGVIGFIDLLNNRITDPQHKEVLKKLQMAAEAQRAIMNDVMDYSKISAGGLELETCPFDLRTVVETVTSRLGAEASRGVVVGCRVDPVVPKYFIGDAGRIEQIVRNLVGNAVRFTSKGSVMVHMGGTLEVGIGSGTQFNLVLTVQDTGTGITAERQEGLFSAFMEPDPAYARDFESTGLGLAIVKELIGRMGGEIVVDSKPGLGSKFIISLGLPVSSVLAAKSVTTAEENSIRQLAVKMLRILVVEDFALVREMLSAALTDAGHVVMCVENGAEALEAVLAPTSEPFDLVLMDMHMPVMSGPEATRKIRALPEPRNSIPIIGLSAGTVKELVEKYVDAGIDGYVTKPIDWAKLSATIKSVLNTSSIDHVWAEEAANEPTELIMGRVFREFSEHLDEGEYQRILNATIDFFLEHCNKLDGLVANPNFVSLKEVAHAISGAASTVGAVQAAIYANDIAALDEAPHDMSARAAMLSDLMRRSFMELDSQFKATMH